MKIALISCTKLKETKPCTASHMYMPSNLFKKAKSYVGKNYLYWYILSAEYGFLHPNNYIAPYERTLNNMPSEKVKGWSEKVFEDIMKVRPTEVDFFAGEKYRKYLIPMLEAEGVKCNVPLKGLGIGQQLKFYKKELDK